MEDEQKQTQKQVEAYNDEAEQAYLKALTGWAGAWERHAKGTNLRDLLSSPANDNDPN